MKKTFILLLLFTISICSCRKFLSENVRTFYDRLEGKWRLIEENNGPVTGREELKKEIIAFNKNGKYSIEIDGKKVGGDKLNLSSDQGGCGSYQNVFFDKKTRNNLAPRAFTIDEKGNLFFLFCAIDGGHKKYSKIN